jgi:hypothetical protein
LSVSFLLPSVSLLPLIIFLNYPDVREIDEVPKLGFLSAARKELWGEAGEARGEVGARKGRGERRWRSARWGEAGHAKCVEVR